MDIMTARRGEARILYADGPGPGTGGGISRDEGPRRDRNARKESRQTFKPMDQNVRSRVTPAGGRQERGRAFYTVKGNLHLNWDYSVVDKGYSVEEILRAVKEHMEKLRDGFPGEGVPKPCDYWNDICGKGPGRIVAIMFSMFRMVNVKILSDLTCQSVDACIDFMRKDKELRKDWTREYPADHRKLKGAILEAADIRIFGKYEGCNEFDDLDDWIRIHELVRAVHGLAKMAETAKALRKLADSM